MDVSTRLSASLDLKNDLVRGDILRAAIEVFGVQGIHAARVEDLLTAAGIARRTFYKHFRNKEEVLVKLYGYATRALIEHVEAAQAGSSDPLAGLRSALDRYLAFHVSNRAIVRVLIEEAIRSRSALAPLRASFRDRLVRTLEQSVREISGRSLDRYVFLALISALEGLSLELLTGEGGDAEVDRVRATTLGLIAAVLQASSMLPGAGGSERA